METGQTYDLKEDKGKCNQYLYTVCLTIGTYNLIQCTLEMPFEREGEILIMR